MNEKNMTGRFIIYAASVSPVGTMGGNSKIAIEMVKHLTLLGSKVVVIVPKSKKATFTNNIGNELPVEYVEIDDFIGNELRRPIKSTTHFTKELLRVFDDLKVVQGDTVYACCNFHHDILPIALARRRFKFFYIATHYLFSAFIVENLLRGYRFPAMKYLCVWLYERTLFIFNRLIADAFVITNDSDRGHFSKTWQSKVFAFYGGVNVEQIPTEKMSKTRDVIFCSRLHPQKGVEGLLDIWAMVIAKRPLSKLTIIGNGAPEYEHRLKDKARKLGVNDSIEWLGYVNNKEKYRIYVSAKVFAHATVFDNNGMVAAEALCSGLPVVMYDLPALRDVYHAGCLKVACYDKNAYAETLLKILNNIKLDSVDTEVLELRKKWDWAYRVDIFRSWLTQFVNF